MSVTIQLGKNMGSPGVGTAVRSVSFSSDAAQIDCTARGDTSRKYKAGFKSATVEVECLEDPGAAIGSTVSISNGHATGSFKVMSVARNEPLDDVVSYTITCQRTNAAAGGGGGS